MFGRILFSKIYTVLFILFLVPLIGMSGYIWIEGLNLIDAFYMTIITVSTVGFEEVKPLSSEGRIFTSLLIILSFGTFAYAVSVITSYVLSGDFKRQFKDLKVNKNIDKLNGHTIVCGYGRNGQRAAKELERHEKEYVVIENDPEVIQKMRLQNTILFVEGDAKEDHILERAGVRRAKSLISAMPEDSDNLYVVLTARTIHPQLFIVSRASNEGADRKLRMAGADNVIMPDRIGGAHMAALTIKPDVMEFLDAIFTRDTTTVNVEEINCENLASHLSSGTVGELSSKITTGASVIGFRTPDGKYVINPAPETTLVKGSKLFVLGTPEQMKDFS